MTGRSHGSLLKFLWCLSISTGLWGCVGSGHPPSQLPDGQLVNAVDIALPDPPQKAPDLDQWWHDTEAGTIRPTDVQQHIPTEALIDWLIGAYQRGMSPNQVRTALQSAQWQTIPDDLQQVDIDGDGLDEWLVTVYLLDPDFMAWGAPGDFWVIGTNGLAYRFFTPDRYFDDNYEAQPEFFLGAPTAIATTDMTGDGLADVVLSRTMCGAHTCTYFYSILSHHGGQIENVVATPESEAAVVSEGTITMTYAEVQPLEDATGDGLPDFLIHGGWVGSAGSGIQRTRTEVWGWNGEAIALMDVRLDPTEFRYHLLWEANDEFARGNRDRARVLYQQVIGDRTLLNEGSFAEEQAVYDDSRKFAAFRMGLLELMNGNSANASEWSQWLDEQYPADVITEAANILVTMAENVPLEASCAAVRDYLMQFETVDGEWVTDSPTGALRDLGYANPSLTAADVCPL